MSLEDLINFEPQITDIKYGPERCLRDLILDYYTQHGVERRKAYQYRDDYLKELAERFQVSPRGAG